MLMKRRLLALLMTGALMFASPTLQAFADDSPNNNQAPAPEWEYRPQENGAKLQLLSSDSSGSADVVRVRVTAEDRDTGETVAVPGATVNLYVGADLRETATADDNGYAEISLAGLDLVDRMNASVSANTIVSRGKGINGNSRDKLFSNLPKDEDGNYYRYTLELHSETIDEHGNWGGADLPVSYESNKVDIVFAIDATGSMADKINDVKDNVAAFSEQLIDSGLDIRFGIIEYRDVADGEETVIHKQNGTHWLTSIDSVVDVLKGIEATGGGDTPETVLDALGYVADPDLVSWRSDAYRQVFVLTDAGIKNNNGYGYENLAALIPDLTDDNVVASVITSTGYQDEYESLIEATGGIWSNINSSDFGDEMLGLSTSIIDSVAKDMTLKLSEPRLLLNLTTCYFADDKQSQSAEYRASVQATLDEYANRLAETTDGHVLVDKMLLFSTDNRLNFYDTDEEASMADIRIESEVSDDGTWWNNIMVWANAHPSGFFTDETYVANFDDENAEHFSHLKGWDEFDGKRSFYRIQMGALEGASDGSIDLIDDSYKYSLNIAHESGHYLMGFRDEYQNYEGDNWDEVGGKPNPLYGLMDQQQDDLEMSRMDTDYSYVDNPATLSKNLHTRHSWTNSTTGFSCEGVLANLLSESGYSDWTGYVERSDYKQGDYVATYTKVNSATDRTAQYSYAGLSPSDYLSLPASLRSSATLMTAEDSSAATQDRLAEITWTNSNDNVVATVSNASGIDCALEMRKSGDSSFAPINFTSNDSGFMATLPIAKGEVAEVRLIASGDAGSEYNVYFVDRSNETSAGYMYSAADNGTIAYVSTDVPESYTFIADNTGYINGDYFSVNQATHIASDNGTGFSSGEIYSVADYMADIDYTTLSWFKLSDGAWTQLATDYSDEETMNIGARADLNGEGTYVLMAKKAPTSGALPASNLSFRQMDDRDAVVELSFDDPNETSKYYNVYYSESQFTDKTADRVAVRSYDAGSTDLTLNLIERNRVVYAAIEIVLEDGTRSELSPLIRLEAGEADSDGDGIPDWYCDQYGLWGDPEEDKDIANSDDDGDGLTNLEEYKGGSDPTDPNDPTHTTNVPVESIEIDPAVLTVYVGDEGTLTAVIAPENATEKGVEWTVSDPSVATIESDGATCKVTGISSGTTTVIAVSDDGGFSASATVTVTEEPADPEPDPTPDPDPDPTPDPDPDPDDPCPSEEFPDIDTSAWYHESLDWAIENGVMNGYSDSGLFGPDNPLAREQAACVLWNMLGAGDESAKASAHADVEQGTWYSNAVNWAVENGYINGYSGTDLFGVGDSLTREQFACVIANAAGADLDDADASSLDGLPDADKVSDWAVDAVSWAVDLGVINGVELEDGSRELQPGRTISRAEMAAMMKNAVDKGVLELAE